MSKALQRLAKVKEGADGFVTIEKGEVVYA